MRNLVLMAVLIASVAGAGFAAYQIGRGGRSVTPDSLMGTVWPEPRDLGHFELLDHNGAEFGLQQLQGQWTLIFFGYTSCPDICPSTMLTLRGVSAALDEMGTRQPQVVLVSVDPQRDTAEKLGEYVRYFNAAFLGVTGAEEQLYALALQVGGMYQLLPPDAAGNYEVAHSASIFLVDPQARMYAAFSPPHQAVEIAEKLVQIGINDES
jgi:protein SCO1/2